MDALSATTAARPFDVLGIQYEKSYGHLPEQLAALRWLAARLPAGARVLDIGSGTGRPTAQLLADSGYEVTGIDVSATMVELARSQVPNARFELADVREFDTRPGSWDAICAFFPLLQMPRNELDATLERIGQWLAPGGFFVFATVPLDVEEYDMVWMGQQVRATSYPTEEYLSRLRAAGLDVVHARVSTFEPDFPGMGVEEHLFCYAHKPGGPVTLSHALCGPYPLPAHYRGPHILTHDGWLDFERRLEREDITPVVDVLAANTTVLDVGGGGGAVVRAIAERLGGCITVEPDAARKDSMASLREIGVDVRSGRAEHLQLPDNSVDAAVTTWVLHYTDDPLAAVADLARVVDCSHPEAKVVIVQAAPDNEIVGLWNQVCAPLVGEPVDHHGFLLAAASRVLAEHGFEDVSLHRVGVRVRFDEDGLDAKVDAAAAVLTRLWHTDSPSALRQALRPVLAERFTSGDDSLSDDGVMLVARPRRTR